MGDVPIIMFPFRLFTNIDHYIREVVKYATKQMESVESLRVDLLFVEGIPEHISRAISAEIVRRMSVKQVEGGGDIHIHGQGNVDEDYIAKLERYLPDLPVIQL